MGQTIEQTNDSLLKTAIEAEIAKLAAAQPLAPATRESQATALYVKKLQGKYDVRRAKNDTDNAIDLLSIGYHTTPQTEPAIRNKIREIMTKLVMIQRVSREAMQAAMDATVNAQTIVEMDFEEWLSVRAGAGSEPGVTRIKAFLTQDLAALAKPLQAQALGVKANLDRVAASYDSLILETSNVTAASETALGRRLEKSAEMAAQINKSNAKRKALDNMVKELAASVDKYEKEAQRYATAASTAEERAFIMSIVQVGAQMVSAAIPAIVTALTAASTGGASVVAAAAANTVSRAVGDKNGTETKADPTDAELIKKKQELLDKTVEAQTLAKSIGDQKDGIAALEGELKAQQDKDGKPQAEAPSAAAAKLQERIDAKKKALEADENKYAVLAGALSGLQAAMTALDKGLGRISKQAEDTASGLRQLQMKMLDKVEAYEKERRAQNAELVEITALLAGQMDAQETMQLSIQCLNVSQSALKRTQEIITEIAGFFASFAAFMGQMSTEAGLDIALFESAGSRSSIVAIANRTDKFFMRVTAEWHAVDHVSGLFSESFADGYSKLNKLSSQHIVGDALTAYLEKAKDLIDEIVAEREAAASAKVVEIQAYRTQLSDGPRTAAAA